MINESRFHARLQAAMENKGWTAKDLIKQLLPYSENIASSTKQVSNWLKGTSKPRVDTLLALCDLFECTPDYLLGFDDCTQKNYQYISSETGLSEGAIKALFDNCHNLTIVRVPGNRMEEHVNDTSLISPLSKTLERIPVDLMLFCKDLLQAAESQKVIDANNLWDTAFSGNMSIEKIRKQTEKVQKRTSISAAEYDDLKAKQNEIEYALNNGMQHLIHLLANH